MARNLSSVGVASALANETGEEWVVLLTVTHPDWAVPKRFARRKTALLSRGETYFPVYFDLTFPDQIPNQLPRCQITIDNIDETVLSVLRAVATAPDIVIELVRASDPDQVEMTTGADYQIKSYAYTASTIVCEISMEDLLGEGFPGPRILPSNFPGGF